MGPRNSTACNTRRRRPDDSIEVDDTADDGGLPVLPKHGLVRLKTILKLIPVGRTTWYEGVRNGRYPEPQQHGRIPMWNARDIRYLIDHGTMPGKRQPRAARARQTPTPTTATA